MSCEGEFPSHSKRWNALANKMNLTLFIVHLVDRKAHKILQHHTKEWFITSKWYFIRKRLFLHVRWIWSAWSTRRSPYIVKVRRDMPPKTVCLFAFLFSPRVYFFGNFSGDKGAFLAILVKERSSFGNSCVETQTFDDFGLVKAKLWHFFL